MRLFGDLLQVVPLGLEVNFQLHGIVAYSGPTIGQSLIKEEQSKHTAARRDKEKERERERERKREREKEREYSTTVPEKGCLLRNFDKT